MTPENYLWKPRFFLGLYFLVLHGIPFVPQCQGQGANFFYYFSPNQGTQFQQTTEHGQFFQNPFLTQPSVQQQQQPQSQQQNFIFSNLRSPIQTQQTTTSQRPQLLGYHNQQQRQTPASTFITQAPLGHLQYQFPQQQQQPQEQEPPQQEPEVQQEQQPQQHQFGHTTFPTFNRFGNFLNYNAAPPQQTTLSPAGNPFRFFENPFQFVQQRLQTTLTPPALAPEEEVAAPTPISTLAPPPPPPPAPSAASPEFPSRFRYVIPQQPQVPQYNPYSHLGSPYNSDLPYTEQRYYSTKVPSSTTSTSPAGFSYSIGGDNEGTRSSVHVSMGPVNHIQQHLTEISQARRQLLQQRQRQRPTSTPTPIQEIDSPSSTTLIVLSAAVEAILSKDDESQTQNAQEPPTKPEDLIEPNPSTEASTSTSTTVAPSDSEPSGDALQNEQSIQTETVAASQEVPTGRRAGDGEIIIPGQVGVRRILRKKARKPLRAGVNNSAFPNRLPVEDGNKSEGGKGEPQVPVEVSIPTTTTTTSTTPITPMTTTTTTAAPEVETTPQPTSTSTSAPLLLPEPIATTTSTETPTYQVMIPGPDEQKSVQAPVPAAPEYEYYDYHQEEPQPQPPVSTLMNVNVSTSVSTSTSTTSEEEELPIRTDLRPEDFPGAFKENDEETDQGVEIIRFSQSHPPADDVLPMEISSTTATPSTTSTTTTTSKPEELPTTTPFVKHDPEEEDAPLSNVSESEVPQLEPLTTSTTTPAPSTSTSVVEADHDDPEQEMNEDEHPQAPEPTMVSSTTSTPMKNDTMESGSDEDSGAEMTTILPEHEEAGHIDDFSNYSQEVHDSEIEEDDDEDILKAQRQALAETLRRLRERQQNSTTEVTPADDEEEQNDPENNAIGGGDGGRPPFMRRTLELANLSLPTSQPVRNVNAVLDDNEGEHLSRDQVIEKIQRQRAKFRRVSTTTKRPRRVTRPSTERTVPDFNQIDSYPDSASSVSTTSGPADPYATVRATTTTTTTEEVPELEVDDNFAPTTPFSNYPIMTTTQSPFSFPSSSSSLTTTTETVTTVEPTTTTTTTTEAEPVIMTTIASSSTTTMTSRRRTTTLPSVTTTTTPSTTTLKVTDFYGQNDHAGNDVDEYYEEDQELEVDGPSTSSSSSTTTTSTLTTTEDGSLGTSSTEASVPSSTDAEEVIFSSSSSTESPEVTEETYSTTTGEPAFSVGTTTSTPTMTTTTGSPLEVSPTSATGQLIIHEILPTMPPLKEVSFVVGESVEDDQSIDSASDEGPSPGLAPAAVVRVEAKVSEVVVAPEPQQQQTSEVSDENAEFPITSSEMIKNGRKVRVVIKRQRKTSSIMAKNADTSADQLSSPPSSSSAPTPGAQIANGDGRRRRRKILRQLMRPIPVATA